MEVRFFLFPLLLYVWYQCYMWVVLAAVSLSLSLLCSCFGLLDLTFMVNTKSPLL